jgi:excinuclease UvrABC helicase subunit UvrB
MVIKSYIIFEMTPGFYGAKLEDQSYEEALFGKEINKLPFIQIQEALKELNNEIFDTFTDFSSKEFSLKSLEEELKEALDNEDYETAAKLRDKIKNK